MASAAAEAAEPALRRPTTPPGPRPTAAFDRAQRRKVDQHIDATYARFKQVTQQKRLPFWLAGPLLAVAWAGLQRRRQPQGRWGRRGAQPHHAPRPLRPPAPTCPRCHPTQRVEEGRRLPAAEVAKVAKGRVWTGEQALGLGLVDKLGGLAQALALAKQEAGLPLEEGAVLVKQVGRRPGERLLCCCCCCAGQGGQGGAKSAAAQACCFR